ncbi:unnamed protein product [Owenia fusiformis]|uniref:Uncharacterized protein n=1 Tax=Owenia fusiformis TaxID=6347 RepID=A0A8J1Y0Z5_OWEFU|nr:unnamed protein product [Owenia fusiformis]
MSVEIDQTTCEEHSLASPLKILNRGPEYFKMRMLERDSGLLGGRRKSAVELLEASKHQYVKSSTVLQSRQRLSNSENLQVGNRHARGVYNLQYTHNQDNNALNTIQRNRRESHSNSIDTNDNNNTHSSDVDDTDGVDHHSAYLDDIEPTEQSEMSQQQSSDSRYNLQVGLLKRPIYSSEGRINRIDLVRDLDTRVTWRDSHTDTASETDSFKGDVQTDSASKTDDVIVRRRPKTSNIIRSRSDLSHRHSHNSCDLSEGSSKISRNSADLDKFFNEMGLDRRVLDPMLGGKLDKIECVESMSSLNSRCARSQCSDVSESKLSDNVLALPEEATSATPERRSSCHTSIIEKNARIIKWLCSVKKARSHSTSN